MAKIIDIEGIGPAYAKKLAASGVSTTGKLLKVAAHSAGRKDLAKQAEVTTKQVLEWVNRADLMRIGGVGTQYSDLLEASGVDTVVQLAQRNAQNLSKKMAEVNGAKSLVRVLPSPDQVADWVAQAAKLPRVISH
jgi:predicted flap endonuclease-1-like 5' DNA nuclease|tara:strand:+ start:4533 stop:4937 length:405 start_codon:yes stop_codon:yes gene_type:complete